MLDILSMFGNYNSRKICRYPDNDNWIIDTCEVTDSSKPFETAIRHKKYNNGKIVIVEEYESKENAQKGHDKWVNIISSDKLPDRLIDVSTCEIAIFLDDVTGSGFRQNPLLSDEKADKN